MTFLLSPIWNGYQAFQNDGTPASGYKIHTYSSGTTVDQPTYTDSTGTVANPNPLVLNSSGRPVTAIWFQSGKFYSLVLTDPLGNVIQTVNAVYGVPTS